MEVLKLALLNLLRRKARTSLTILGVTVAIAFTVGLLSVSEGFLAATDSLLSRQKEHLLVLPKETAGHPMPMVEAYGTNLSQDLEKEIKKIKNVKNVYPVYVQTLMSGTKLTSFSALNGITLSYLPDLRPYLNLKEGRLFQEGEKDVVVLGSTFAKEQDKKLGDSLKIKKRELKIIGILKPTGGMLGFEDMIVYLPLPTLQEIFQAEGKVTFFALTLSDISKSKETASEISQSIPEVAAQTLEEVVSQARGWIKTARTIHFIIASFALLIGVLFVLSTMMMSVSERTKEIGTLRAIGGGRGFVFRLILTESAILGLFAGVFGCLFGYLISLAITHLAAKFLELTLIQTKVSFRILTIGMGTAFLIGALAGLYPAFRISKIEITKALKYE